MTLSELNEAVGIEDLEPDVKKAWAKCRFSGCSFLPSFLCFSSFSLLFSLSLIIKFLVPFEARFLMYYLHL